MKRALIVGINDYSWSPLKGCENDARRMTEVLSRHYDGRLNFNCKMLLSSETQITEDRLRKELTEILNHEGDTALIYFSGHGSLNPVGGSLVTQKGTKYNDGLPIRDLVTMVNRALHIREIVIILDCCYSGQTADSPDLPDDTAQLRKGISILASSLDREYSAEKNGQGLFTSIIAQGLEGAAADLSGQVNTASLYSYVDRILGPWDQRPVFKSYVSTLTTLRECEPTLPLSMLRQIASFFETEDSTHALSPEYEPTLAPHNPDKERVFAILQKFNSAGLLRPIQEEHMYYAAKNSTGCALTQVGKLYWKLVKNNRL
ncbi:MAG: caspase family protein [Bacteroidia bacterium]|nr:caspase family protein [Bacteroidia bacterium]